MYNRKNTLTVLIFAVLCLAGVVLMALGGYDKDEAFTRSTLAMVATEGWMYAYNKRLDRSKWTKWIVRITIIFQALIGLLMCFSPFESHYAIGSVHFWLSLAGAVIWTVFSVLMSCVLYHTD